MKVQPNYDKYVPNSRLKGTKPIVQYLKDEKGNVTAESAKKLWVYLGVQKVHHPKKPGVPRWREFLKPTRYPQFKNRAEYEDNLDE